MIGALDIFAFVVFGVLLLVFVVILVTLGQLPGQIAVKRGHPQAAAINVASWMGIAAFGVFWPLALIWAFLKPDSTHPSEATFSETASSELASPLPVVNLDTQALLRQMQGRVDALEAVCREIQVKKEEQQP